MSTMNIKSSSIPAILLSAILSTAAMSTFVPAAWASHPEAKNERPHSLKRAFSGQVALDLWGWSGTISYQRTKGHATPEYFVEKIARQSNHWGANMIECMPFKIACGGYVMGWDKNDTISEPQKGVYFYRDPHWTDDRFRGILSAIHEMDMLNFFCINSIGTTWGLHEGWQKPDQKDEVDVMRRWCRDFFNPFLFGEEKAYFGTVYGI